MKFMQSVGLSLLFVLAAVTSPFAMAVNCFDKYQQDNVECFRLNYDYREFEAFFKDSSNIEQKVKIFLVTDFNSREVKYTHFDFEVRANITSAPTTAQTHQMLWDFRQAFINEQLYRYNNTTCTQAQHCPDPGEGGVKGTTINKNAGVIWLTRAQTVTRGLDQGLNIAANGLTVAEKLRQNSSKGATEVQFLWLNHGDGNIADICKLGSGNSCISLRPVIDHHTNTATGELGYSLQVRVERQHKNRLEEAIYGWHGPRAILYRCNTTSQCDFNTMSCTVTLTCTLL